MSNRVGENSIEMRAILSEYPTTNMSMKRNALMILGFTACIMSASAQTMSTSLQTNPPTDFSKIFKSDKEKNSYAVGMFEGSRVKPFLHEQSNEVDVSVVIKAFSDMLNDSTRITEAQEREVLTAFEMKLRAKQAEKQQAVTKAGVDFLAKNKDQPGVNTLTNGLQYKILTMGTGEMPKADDMVTVNYQGTHVDGTEFDSSTKSGVHEFQANHVIPGWTQALQLMPVGSKWQLFIPSDLAYGPRGHSPTIGPNETLIFEVELLATKPGPPAASATPSQMTSDIIKVPSAEGLKHGEKIETIKASDVGKIVTKTNN
jgi:FKBP-type peptidyl-prolyl cis-trans isomerase FklB